jgi:adenine-specific DNA glycosylase
MFVDEGSFQVAMDWCFERSPNCSQCPLNTLCLAGQGSGEHFRWTAYQKFEAQR